MFVVGEQILLPEQGGLQVVAWISNKLNDVDEEDDGSCAISGTDSQNTTVLLVLPLPRMAYTLSESANEAAVIATGALCASAEGDSGKPEYLDWPE